MTDTISNPFADQNEQVNPLDYAKTKFANESGEIDLEKLARGKFESDRHIQTLETELAELRKKAEQGMAVKDLLEAIKSNRPASEEPTPAPKDEGDPAAKSNERPIEEIVAEQLSKKETERKETENFDTVVNKLNEVWGNNVSTELRKAASALGMSVKELEGMGRKSPQALFKLLGVDNTPRPPSGTTAPTSSVNLGTRNPSVRNQSYYNELYKSNPKLRTDPKTAAQEMRDAIALGADFFN